MGKGLLQAREHKAGAAAYLKKILGVREVLFQLPDYQSVARAEPEVTGLDPGKLVEVFFPETLASR